MHNRRDLLTLAWSSAVMMGVGCAVVPPANPTRELEALEHQVGGRLGVAFLNARTGDMTGWRVHERFAMCSTFKLLLAAVILEACDRGELSENDPVPYSEDDMVPYAPITTKFLERGEMSVLELARAAQTVSDNVAANLLLRLIGGPDGFTKRLRRWGDPVTRLDRYEPTMNLVRGGDARDTTTPAAMAASVGRLLTGSVLGDDQRSTLLEWAIATRTGAKRLRSGLSEQWLTGNKTGTSYAQGYRNMTNDVALVSPTEGQWFVVAAYYQSDDHYPLIRQQDQRVIASVGEIASRWIGRASATDP